MAEHPRSKLADGFGKLKVPQAKKFADFLRQGETGLTPCWGAIAKRFDSDFKSAADRTAMWRSLVELGEKSAQLLFVQHNLSNATVLETIAQDAPKLPAPVQRVLVSLDEVRSALKGGIQDLAPEAQQIWASDAATRHAERVRFESRMAKLVAIDFIVPDESSPEAPPPEESPPRESAPKATRPKVTKPKETAAKRAAKKSTQKEKR